MTTEIRTALHVSLLDPWVGYGVTRRPNPDNDLAITPGECPLHWADFAVMMKQIGHYGWEPAIGDDGDFIVETTLADGSDVIALEGDALDGWDGAAFIAARATLLAKVAA